MPERTRLFAAGAITAIAVVVFVSTLAHATAFAPEEEVASPTLEASAPRHTAAGAPSRVRVPRLSINAAVQDVGVGKTGNMAVPSNFTDVAWYRYGPQPGQPGNAVFDGHVDNGLALAGVFKRLNEIKSGDDIYIDTGTSTVHFVVSDVEVYPKDAVPTAQIFTKSGEPGVVFITCDGAWVQGEKTYDHRLVVYARLASAS